MKRDGAEFTHIDPWGRLRMVDVSEKGITAREARAEAVLYVDPQTLRRIEDREIPKGNVYEAARLAGIMAAKRTWDLIPLCHPLQLTSVEIDFASGPERSEIKISSRVRTHDRTGVEMEALVAATHAALTIYDMCKAVDRAMEIRSTRLVYKTGGRSGTYER
jgi:cyclic pyranopterin phosphate synthase